MIWPSAGMTLTSAEILFDQKYAGNQTKALKAINQRKGFSRIQKCLSVLAIFERIMIHGTFKP